MFHPWRALRRRPAIDVTWRPLEGHLGLTDGRNEIVLDPRQSQRQRRCTLTHELAHIELGHVGGCTPGEEAAARQWAARVLIGMDDLMSALRWADDLETVADELWVDAPTLLDRLDGLDAAERQQLIDLHHTIEQGA